MSIEQLEIFCDGMTNCFIARINELEKRIEVLEANKCNCLTEEELANEKLGGTDLCGSMIISARSAGMK